MTNIFLIGPSGIGKSSTGKELAKLLNKNFIDQDEMFKKKYGSIGKFAEEWSWKIFVIRNARHLLTLLKKHPDSVWATSPKAFVNPLVPKTEKIVTKQCNQSGINVLILPSKSLNQCQKIIFKRLANRPYKTSFDDVVNNICNSYFIKKYISHADIVIFDDKSPKVAAKKIYKKLYHSHYL